MVHMSEAIGRAPRGRQSGRAWQHVEEAKRIGAGEDRRKGTID
ncbi:uncharacterized protein G2W53_013380 [Senna tora]|uniref:Uncharacterized protein n=1 Tax=Senna tora TaxID=362788 RepID=A0A834TZ41_9FABA|nr:uncharacterized protein G2W53_013380 [Senna tora]